MANHYAMTIRDYLEAGNGRLKARQRADSTPRMLEGRTAFRDLLTQRQSPAGGHAPAGLTAADYRAAAIEALPRVPAETDPAFDLKKADSDHGRPAGIDPDRRLAGAPGPPARPDASALASGAGERRAPLTPAGERPDRDLLIDRSVRKAARRYDLAPGLIRAVIRAESDFRTDAQSSAGAQGLMQLMPATARELGVQDSFDIDQNIDGGSRYLRQMLDRYSGDLRTALAAYNAGPGNVDKYGGRVPFAETRRYVERVLRFSRMDA